MIEIFDLKDITTKIGSGSTPTGGNESYKTSGISLIRSMNVYDFVFDYDGLAYIDDEQAYKLRGVTIEEDDILLNITGASVARCCMVPLEILPARVNQHVSIIRIDKNIANPKYVLFFINSPSYKSYLLGLSAAGATREALTKEVIENLKIPLPRLPIQNRIASILSSYDELIENNKQRIKLLEEMAEEIYKEWFVRMRFPGYETAKFFNEHGVEVKCGTEGGLPEGWVNGSIGDICNVGRGSSPRPITDEQFFKDGTIPWIKIADATSSSKFILETKEYVNEHGASFSRYLDEGSLIIATSGTLGFSVILGVKGCIHDGWIYFNDYKKGITPMFMYFKINSLKEYFNNFSYGAAIQNINTEILRKTPILIPTIDVLNKFYLIIEPIDKEHKILLQKNQLLQQTRDLLLPRLISGKLSIEHLLYAESEGLMAAEPKSEYQVK